MYYLDWKLKPIIKFRIILIFLVILCGGTFLYIERSHLGYFTYLYSSLTNSETNQLENHLESVLKDNPDQLFNEFKKVVDLASQNINVCHGIAHKLGHKSYELYGFERSMQIAQPYCGAGFIHGVIESKFGALRDVKALNGMSSICNEKDEKCNHGIGHGLMVLTKNHFQEALTYCDNLHLSARSDCYDGVFMHIFDNEETGVSKKIPERAEGVSLCERVGDVYKKSCYFYVPRIFARDENVGIESKDLCDQVTGDNQKVCIFGAGTMIGKYMYSDPVKAKIECQAFVEKASLCEVGISVYRDKVF